MNLDKTILLLNGPNLNLLGIREPEKYGNTTLQDIEMFSSNKASAHGYDLVHFQSNHEGEIIDKIHEFRDSAGIIINPGALGHYSIAIYDALAIGSAHTIEVHLTNLHTREPWRKETVITGNVTGYIAGLGYRGYLLAVEAIIDLNEASLKPDLNA